MTQDVNFPRLCPMPLPVGYQLLEYQIDKVLSGGGFSFVYLAHDTQGQVVAIKEYFPTTLANRNENQQVSSASDKTLTGFRQGLKGFFEEGRALAGINHQNIVRVLNFFRANDTVYMVMQYEKGETLQELMVAQNATEPFIYQFFGDLLTGLREVHTQKLLHLDIKPSNIFVRRDGSPVLLDFGSARQALANDQIQLHPTYTPGFASPEQYFDRKNLGPWSDIYSIGATLYACLLRITPQSADKRSQNDELIPAVKAGRGQFSPHLLQIVDTCLAQDPLKRPQSVFSLQKSLREAAAQKKPSLLGTLRNSLFGSRS